MISSMTSFSQTWISSLQNYRGHYVAVFIYRLTSTACNAENWWSASLTKNRHSHWKTFSIEFLENVLYPDRKWYCNIILYIRWYKISLYIAHPEIWRPPYACVCLTSDIPTHNHCYTTLCLYIGNTRQREESDKQSRWFTVQNADVALAQCFLPLSGFMGNNNHPVELQLRHKLPHHQGISKLLT